MPNQHLVPIEIPPADLADLTNHLKEALIIAQKFGFSLTKEQRKKLFKMGDRSTDVADKIKTYLSTNPEFIPNYVDAAKFAKDHKLATDMSIPRNLSEQLFQLLDDTVMAAGSDIMDTGMSYYTSVRSAAHDGVTSAKSIYDDLKTRFPGRAPKSTPAGE